MLDYPMPLDRLRYFQDKMRLISAVALLAQ